jgi:hypothetical protein
MTATETAAPLRQIQPVGLTGLTPKAPSSGVPTFDMVDPRDLWVDPAYQRPVGEKGIRQVRQIIEHFDWSKFSPPVCSFAEDASGKSVLKVIDGQHTAIACASHPMVRQIPVMVVDAASTVAQAEAFIGQNRDRLGVSRLHLHYAAVTAEEPEAVTVDNACKGAGVTLLRFTPKTYEPGQTVAVAAIYALTAKRGALHTRQVLRMLGKAEMAPITTDQIKAVDHLLSTDEFKDAFEPDALIETISKTDWSVNDEAGRFAATHKVPKWQALASVWFQRVRKRRKLA